MSGLPTRSLALVFLAAVPAIGPASARGQDASIGTEAPTLRPGDMVRITVWRQPELSGEFLVLGTGAIGHPLYKEVPVSGVPLEAAQGRLRQFLKGLEADPQFVFEPLLSVAVGGEVRSPDLYHLPPQTTLAEAVARAGGPTESGKTDDVRLFRDGREQRLDLRDPNRAATRLLVRSGDEIVVQRKSGFNFFTQVFTPLVSTAGLVVSIIRISR